MTLTYERHVAEQYLPHPRAAVWESIVAHLGVGSLDDRTQHTVGTEQVTARVISYEAPWRVVFTVDDAPVGFHEEAVIVVTDPGGSIAMWQALIETPDADDAELATYRKTVAESLSGRLQTAVASSG